MSKYVLKGSIRRGSRVSAVGFGDGRKIMLDGDPVELTQDEYDQLSARYVLQEITDIGEQNEGPQDEDEQDDNPADEPENTDPPEKGGDK